MEKHEFIQLLQKYERGDCSQEEEKLFNQFCKSLNEYPDQFSEWEFSEKEKVRLEIYTGIRSRISVTRKQNKWSQSVFSRVAASLIITAVTGILALQLMIDNQPPQQGTPVVKSTERGQRSTITLPDGSIVHLNGQSRLSFNDKFSDTARTVELTGEAFFEVTQDSARPFIIRSNEVITTVLGTSFNIQAYPEFGNIEVTVATGRVKVESGSIDGRKQHVELIPEEQATFSSSANSLTKHVVDLYPHLAWKDDIILLNNKSLFETSKILSRWYDVDFRFENEVIKECEMSGEFKSSTLENLLENMSFITGIDYRIENGDKIVLSGDSCN